MRPRPPGSRTDWGYHLDQLEELERREAEPAARLAPARRAGPAGEHLEGNMAAMKRLAWFSPIPFSPPGTPDHHGQLITSLRDQYLIDIFSPATGGKLELSNVSSPYDFVWKHAKEILRVRN